MKFSKNMRLYTYIVTEVIYLYSYWGYILIQLYRSCFSKRTKHGFLLAIQEWLVHVLFTLTSANWVCDLLTNNKYIDNQ